MNSPIYCWCYIGDVDEVSLLQGNESNDSSSLSMEKDDDNWLFLGDIDEIHEQHHTSQSRSSSEWQQMNLSFTINGDEECFVTTPHSPNSQYSGAADTFDSPGSSPRSVALSDADMDRIYSVGKPRMPYKRRNSILIRDTSTSGWLLTEDMDESESLFDGMAKQNCCFAGDKSQFIDILPNNSAKLDVIDDVEDDPSVSESDDSDSCDESDSDSDVDLHITWLETMTRAERRQRAKVAWQIANGCGDLEKQSVASPW
jgi:hypothetical protein